MHLPPIYIHLGPTFEHMYGTQKLTWHVQCPPHSSGAIPKAMGAPLRALRRSSSIKRTLDSGHICIYAVESSVSLMLEPYPDHSERAWSARRGGGGLPGLMGIPLLDRTVSPIEQRCALLNSLIMTTLRPQGRISRIGLTLSVPDHLFCTPESMYISSPAADASAVENPEIRYLWYLLINDYIRRPKVDQSATSHNH